MNFEVIDGDGHLTEPESAATRSRASGAPAGPSSAPALDSRATSPRKRAVFRPATIWVVFTPATLVVPATLGCVSQAAGCMASPASPCWRAAEPLTWA